jgi:hypothetical protein
VPADLGRHENDSWLIHRVEITDLPTVLQAGWSAVTLLKRLITDFEKWSAYMAVNQHLHDAGDTIFEIVMEDSRPELARHLPIWKAARGRVLISGLGLGCVVRGLLTKPSVEHIDVVELDPWIIEVVGPEFAGDPRVSIHQGDALTFEWPADARWDFAWHDIVANAKEVHLQKLHTQLIMKFADRVKRQGAWNWPREFRKLAKRNKISRLGLL